MKYGLKKIHDKIEYASDEESKELLATIDKMTDDDLKIVSSKVLKI